MKTVVTYKNKPSYLLMVEWSTMDVDNFDFYTYKGAKNAMLEINHTLIHNAYVISKITGEILASYW